MVNAAGILSIRAEDTDLDENVKRRVSNICTFIANILYEPIYFSKVCAGESAEQWLKVD